MPHNLLYTDCEMMKAWRDGLLSPGEALNFLNAWQCEIIAEIWKQEEKQGEQRLKDAGVIAY